MIVNKLCRLTGFFLAAGLLALASGSCSGKKDKKFLLTATLQEGPFIESLTESGTLEAVNSTDLVTPDISRNFLLVYLIEEGAIVKQGDRVAQFDTAEIEKELQNINDRISDKKDEIENLMAKQKDELTDSSNTILTARDTLDIERINKAALEFAPEVDKRAGEIRFRQREADVEKYEARYRTLLNDHLRQRRQKQSELKRLYDDKAQKEKEQSLCTVYAPKAGLIVYNTQNVWTKVKIKNGDLLRRSQKFISLPDLDRMQVKLEVNEVDIQRLRRGMAATIVLDAVPDKTFHGVIQKIGSLAYGKPSNPEIMIFETVVTIQESNPEVLRPGMTAKTTIVISRSPLETYLPIDTIFEMNDDKGKVYVLDETRIRPAEVRVGAKNDDYVVVSTDLNKNTRFLLFHPDIQKDKNLDLSKYTVESFKPGQKVRSEDTNKAGTNKSGQTNAKPVKRAVVQTNTPNMADTYMDDLGSGDKKKTSGTNRTRVRRPTDGGSGSNIQAPTRPTSP